MVDIPNNIFINVSDDPIKTIIESTYPNILENINDLNYFQERAILAPTLLNVDIVNEYMLSMISRKERIYLSSNSVCRADANIDSMDDLYTTEYLNSIRMSGLPNHVLKLKVSAPVMLLRNIKSLGLCNSIRLIISQLGKHVLEAKVISGSNVGQKIIIPKMVITPSDVRLSFKLRSKQFSLAVYFAMTINKSQGQSLSNVGLYLSSPIFTHG